TDPDTAGLRLTGPALAVSGAATQGGWPETSGPFTIRSSSDTMIVAVPARSSRPVVRFRIASSDDGRDRLAAGAGLLITRDRETIAYGTRPGSMGVAPLAWDRMYALVSPTVPVLARPGGTAELARFRSPLALDAVRSEARGAEPPFSMAAWTCRSGFPSGGRPRPRVIYPQGDAVARGLAERIVALSPVRVTAAGLPPDALDQSLQGAEDAAFVLPFPRTGAACEAGPPIPAGASIEPLVDSRAHLIIRREAPPVTLDADGIPRVVP